MAFSIIVVTLVMDIAISSKTYHWDPFCPLRDALAEEGHAGVRKQTFSDLGVVLGLHFKSWLGSDALNSVFMLGLVSRSLFASVF